MTPARPRPNGKSAYVHPDCVFIAKSCMPRVKGENESPTQKKMIVTRQRQASGFVAARLGSDMVVGTYVGKEVGV